ncbi:hypothetical protein BH18ACT15_BH18ACT15_02600 [soil metagenome]
MKRVWVVIFAFALIATAFVSPAKASHSWNGYHWARTSNPFTIKVGDNVTSAWDSHLRTAASDWSADTAGNPLNAAVVTGAATTRKCRPTAGQVEVCNASYGNNGWLGVAQIWVSGGHITQGTAKMNDTYFSTPKYNTPTWRDSVMCQEIGHTWGLDHQDESGADFHTCMDYSSNPDTDNRHPNYHDYQELALIYSHLDSTTTIGRPATQSQGRAIEHIRIDHSTRVTRLSDGSIKITFIFWA